MLAYLFPCVQNIIQTVFDRKQQTRHVAVKRYSSVESKPSSDESTTNEQISQQAMPNNYTNETNSRIFVMPSVDAQTNNDECHGNLLISKCQTSSIVIMRSLQNVYVDSCKNCFVFIGPCYSTFFIRNCQNIKVRTIAQQLRIENSDNVIVEGIVGVKPVLEECKNIQFYSLGCKIYEDLIWQIQKAKIDIFDNQIYQCYDFTPKKFPNFSNGQKINNIEIDSEWEAQISLNDLDWGLKNAYLPRLTSVKKSMISKIYNQSQIKNNFSLVILFAKMSFKQFISAINCQQLCQKFTVIQKLVPKASLKLLKMTSNYGQIIKRVQKNSGDWYFILVKTDQKINKLKVGINIIDERELIWKLFTSSRLKK